MMKFGDGPGRLPGMGLVIGMAIGFGALAWPAGAEAQAAASGQAQHAHVHGAARLVVAIQDRTLSISLEAPLDSLLGFEHPPRTADERRAVEALQARLRAPGDLFRPDPAASCRLTKADARSAIFEPAVAGAASEHADLDASFEFDCVEPARLTRLDLGLFAAYPKLRRLVVEVATARGQFRRELSSPQRSLPLARGAE